MSFDQRAFRDALGRMSPDTVRGSCDPRFAVLRDFLSEQLADQPTGGQAIAVVVEGRVVADLYGGIADPATARPWSADTLACLFSAGKPLAAVAVLRLVEAGRIALDAPIARYWPAFGAAGKDAITVRQALSHMAGIPSADQAEPGEVYDPEALARALEAQAPLFAPGRQACFHSFTYGVIAAELVRRVDGRSLARFFRETIAEPLRLDLHFGLTPAEQARCAELIVVPENPLLQLMTDPSTALGRSWRPLPWGELNSAAFRASGFASLAGHGSALGLARFYAALASDGSLPDGRLLEPDTAAAMLTEQWHQPDAFMGAPVRMGLGVMLSNDMLPLNRSARAFAQPGLGGVAGVGDADRRLGIGIVPNRLAGGLEASELNRIVNLVSERL